jgi:GT2 family glycosyltransferase
MQNLSALTAACLVLRRELFMAVQGFDTTHLPTAFYDVDLCLRLRKNGYRNLWTPYAELASDEPISQQDTERLELQAHFKQEIAHMQQRWGKLLLHDPTYNPNLALDRESFALAFPPRAIKPWRGGAQP